MREIYACCCQCYSGQSDAVVDADAGVGLLRAALDGEGGDGEDMGG